MNPSDLEPKAPQHPVGQVLTHDGRSIALVDLGSDASATLRAAWRESGKSPHESGGVVESAWFLPALGGASLASSSLHAGNVFLATANPASLMTIGTGVGSAVMGPTGIVAQAPFVAASSALIPVVAPLMMFSTVAAVVTSARLDRVQRSLGRLSETVDRLQHALKARDYARLEAAASLLDELESELAQLGRFGADAETGLAMARTSTKKLRAQFGQLAEAPVTSENDARNAVANFGRYYVATILDLRVDALWVHWTLQQDAELVEHRQSRLRKKVEDCVGHFRRLLAADRVGAFHRRLKEECAGSWPRKWLDQLPGGLRLPFGGEADAALQRVEAIRADDHSIRAHVSQWITAFDGAADEAREHSIVVYREPDGERALRAARTRSVRLEKAA